MLVTFKTLDHKIFKLEVDGDETVSDLKSRLEDNMGRENLYKLIYSGKILREHQLVSSYNINTKHFVVLMITKIKPVTVLSTLASNERESEMLTSTSSVISPAIKSEVKAVQEHTEEVEKEETSEQENLQMGENKEQESKVVGLDWIEEQIKEKESHFVAERGFSIALDLVMNTEYLADDRNYLKTIEGMIAFVQKYFTDNDQAVDYLISGIPPSAFPPDNNPLAFLRNNEEFQHIRYLVQSNPGMQQSLLLSFGQKHPDLMDRINKNKRTFVRMLHEPDGAKGLGDDGGIVVDSINNPGNVESYER